MIITSPSFFIKSPQKIISLVPSQTELLYSLGLREEVIGITKFCVHPEEWFTGKTRVGGTKNVNLPLIKKLQADLIIANKEENVKEQIEELAEIFDVWVTDVNNLDDALNMINDIGIITHTTSLADNLISNIQNKFDQLQSFDIINTAYLIWQKPYIAVGGGTFINSMMEYCGLKNIFQDKLRYPEIKSEDLADNCGLILLSSEPYPFKQKHLEEMKQLFPAKKILLVDGEMFSWYGSRLLLAPWYFNSIRKTLDQ